MRHFVRDSLHIIYQFGHVSAKWSEADCCQKPEKIDSDGSLL